MLDKLWHVPPLPKKLNGGGPMKGEVRSELVKTVADEARKRQRKKGVNEVIEPCPGLFSVLDQHEMASCRGLDLSNCLE